MRRLAVLILASWCAGCTTTLAEPVLRVEPYLALYQLRGETKMESPDGAGIKGNPRQPLRSFGQDRTREDVGVRADLGDGFGGIRADYYRLDMNTSRKALLEHDWGRLPAGDLVRIYAVMDDLRLSYIEPIAQIDTQYRDEDLTFRFGAGAQLTHRSLTLNGSDIDEVDMQKAQIDGDVISIAVRAQAVWQDFILDFDYAVAPQEFVLSGDLEDFTQDLEARLSYKLPQRDIRLFAGVRYSAFSASGDANGFRYDTDLVIDGFQLGVSVTL